MPTTPFPFTHVVVTASNETQANGYRACITERKRNGTLPRSTFRVIADPGGVRVGSGTATFHAIRELQKSEGVSLGEFLRTARVLILHSGGDSKRLPAYAAQGKLFLPLPRVHESGEPLTLFDLILSDIASVNIGKRGRVVIAAGDLHLNLASGETNLAEADVVGVSCQSTPETGTRHGVYVLNSRGDVTDFLQKPNVDAMRRRGAISKAGLVNVDTGVLSFSPRAVMALFRASEKRLIPAALSGKYSFDLYEHIMIAIAGRLSSAQYANALGADREHRSMLRDFAERVPELTIRISTASGIRFDHVGSTREVLERLGSCFTPTTSDASVVMNSVIGATNVPKRGCVIDSCVFARKGRLQGRNLVVGFPSTLKRSIVLPKGVGLVALPIGKSDWTVVAFGERDDFKTPFHRGGTLINRLRLGQVGTAWDLPIWHVGTLDIAFTQALAVIRESSFTSSTHHALAEIIPRVNQSRLIAHRLECVRSSRIAHPGNAIDGAAWLSAQELSNSAQDDEGRRLLVRGLLKHASGIQHGSPARTLYAAATVARRMRGGTSTADRLESRAFEFVRASVDATIQIPNINDHNPVAKDQIVWATSPARIDIFGGWSDTPPICSDLGGAVINAAASLNGQYPLQAICRRINEPHIRLNSIDLGGSIVIKNEGELRQNQSPLNWAALPMAALSITGFRPPQGVSLRRHLERFGGGLDITVFSALPKGSGLGASSILGATLIGALLRVTGRAFDSSRVIAFTSVLEQYMSTGGGWQDQVGGITPGVKLLRTESGEFQIPTTTAISTVNALTTAEGRARCVLYYTGRTRLAKNILRSVLGRYLAREREVRTIIDRLKSGTRDMAEAMNAQNTDQMGRLLDEYWNLKKQLDPGSTNADIEALFDQVKSFISGGTLLGAGGGGFALFVAKSERSADKLRDRLSHAHGKSCGRIYDFEIDACGMNIAVL